MKGYREGGVFNSTFYQGLNSKTLEGVNVVKSSKSTLQSLHGFYTEFFWIFQNKTFILALVEEQN